MELHTSMTLADKDPSSFAYALMGTPGYSARIRGEAAQLFRCTPVPARLRTTGDCFKELPVTVDNEPKYLQPKTRVISAKGTPIACDPLSAAIYKINNQWYALTPEAEKLTAAPETIRPGLLPWGRVSATHASIYTVERQEDDVQNELSTSETGSIYTKIIIIITVTISIILLIFVLYALKSGKEKTRLLTPLQSDNAAVTKMHLLRPLHPPISIEPPQENFHEHHKAHLETHHNTYDPHENYLDVKSEISNLKQAYRSLETRINKCTPPRQTGLNWLAVASSQRCSKANEGDVTCGAST